MRRCLLLLLIFQFLHAGLHARTSKSRFRVSYTLNKTSFGASAGLPSFTRTFTISGMHHRYIPTGFRSFGVNASFHTNRLIGVGFGVYGNQFSFEHNITGPFGPGNAYGAISRRHRQRYLSIPLSLYHMNRRGCILRAAYVPGVLLSESSHHLVLTGAADAGSMDAGAAAKKIHHSVTISLAGKYMIARQIHFSVEPFLNYSFGPIDSGSSQAYFRPLTAGAILAIEVDHRKMYEPVRKMRDKVRERRQGREAEKKAREQDGQIDNVPQ